MTRLFLDSADTGHWAQAQVAGWTRRVTCNPLLIDAAGLPVTLETAQLLARRADELELDELHLQAWPDEHGRWEPRAAALAALSPRVVVKLPAIGEALRAIPSLKARGTRVLVTAVSNPLQGLWAAELGADYVAPYIGRLAEAGRDPYGLLEALLALQRRGGPTVLAASVRDLDTLGRLVALGVGAVTLRHALLSSACADPATQEAVTQFEAARQRRLSL
jgi:transaldolase